MHEHDHGYRLLFSHPEMVRDLIRGFVVEDWVERLDFDTLERIPEAFVSEDLRERESDVIWRLRWRGSKSWLYVYLLIEFQTSVDRFMALRVMSYVALLWEALLKAHRERGERLELLPPVLPLVVSRGERRWNAPRDVSELVESPPGRLAGYVPNLSYFLVEERRLDEEELAQMSNLVARIFHIEKSDGLEASVRVLAGALSSLRASGAAGERLQRDLVSWFRRVQEPAKMIPEDALLERSYEELEPMLAESVKRWKEELLAEGERSGLACGRIEILVEMMQARFGDVPPDLRDRLAGADEQRLSELAVRLMSADSIEDVLE